MTARRAVVLALLAALWCWGAWVTREVDSDRPTSSPGAVGEAAPGEQAWTGPAVGSGAAGVARDAVPAAKASRSRRALPAVLLRIRWCESRDRYDAENPRSTASGAWQILDGTWNHFRGYHHASDAPRLVQDQKALLLYRDRGTQPWNASRRCWS